jgi:hypothetical protein
MTAMCSFAMQKLCHKSVRIIVWKMVGSAPSSAISRPFFFTADVRISLPFPPLGPTGLFTHQNGTKSSNALHHLLGACDVVLPMICSPHLASAIVDSSFYAGVPVVPPPAGMACDAARSAVLGYGATEWISSPGPRVGRLHYSSIVRGLIASTSTWPVTGLFPPRLVRAKLRASSLAYWAGGRYLQSAFEVALERTLRAALDIRSLTQQEQRYHILPSSVFDCRQVPVLRGGGGSNTCASIMSCECSAL